MLDARATRLCAGCLQVLHSSAALLRIADMEYSGTNSFFIQVLLNKKYALPYRVVSSCLCQSAFMLLVLLDKKYAHATC